MVRENQPTRSPTARCVLPTAVGDLYGTRNDATNLVLQPAPERGLAGDHEGHRCRRPRLPAGRPDRLRRRRQLRQAGPALQRRAHGWSSSGRPPARRATRAADSTAAPAGDVDLRAADQRRHEPDRGGLGRRPDLHPGRPAGRAGRHRQPAGRAVRPQRRHHRAGGRRGVRLVPGHAGRTGRSRSTRPTSSPATRWTSAGGTRSSGRTRRRTGSPTAALRIDVPNGDIYTDRQHRADELHPAERAVRRLDPGDEGRRQRC